MGRLPRDHRGSGGWEVAAWASKQVPWAPSSMLGAEEGHPAGGDGVLASLSEQAEEDASGEVRRGWQKRQGWNESAA